VEPAAQASCVKGRRGSSTPCAHSTDMDMDTRLQDLRLRLAHACSSHCQAVDGDSSSSAAHGLGPAVSALFDLLATLCPADLLQTAQQLMAPCPAPATAAADGGSHSRQAGCNRSSSSSSSSQAAAAKQVPCEERSWAARLLEAGTGLLLEGAQGLSWQEALQEGPASGGWKTRGLQLGSLLVASRVCTPPCSAAPACYKARPTCARCEPCFCCLLPGTYNTVTSACAPSTRPPFHPSGHPSSGALAAQLWQLLKASCTLSGPSTTHKAAAATSPGAPPPFTLAQLGRALRWNVHMVSRDVPSCLMAQCFM
jgi:hypothetical protein